MDELIIMDPNYKKSKHKSQYAHTYDTVINSLIKERSLRYMFPSAHIGCRIGRDIIHGNDEIYRILSSVYDHIIDEDLSGFHMEAREGSEHNDEKKISSMYNSSKTISINKIGKNDSLFDSDYEYHQIKQILGPVACNHFMFKEKDIEVKLRNGFDFNKKKIRYENMGGSPHVINICNMYHIDRKSLKDYQLKYYHTNRTTQYRPFYITQMFDNIDAFDYLEPIKRLKKYYSSGNCFGNCFGNYFEKLYDRTKKLINKVNVQLSELDYIEQHDKDSIMLEYVKCRPNAFIITLWKPALKTLDVLTTYLKSNGNVYFTKIIKFDKKGLANLMFWMYDEFTYTERLSFIKKKLGYIDTTESDNDVCFIVFDNINNMQLSGQSSPFKNEIRNKILTSSNLDRNKYRGNDLVHINDYFYQTVEYSQMIFNNNSLEVISDQDCEKFAKNDYVIANLKMQTLRKVIYSNMSLLEMGRFIAIGGSILYAYGIRSFNDIDSIVLDVDHHKTDRIVGLTEKFFADKKSKFYFVDSGIPGSRLWVDKWTNINKIIHNFLNIDGLKELILDPKHYFYHQGIKMVTLEYEIIRKIIRNRTEDHVDFMMLNLLYPRVIRQYVILRNGGDLTGYEDDVNNKYFAISDKYKKIRGIYNDKYPQLRKIVLERRYSPEQINKVAHIDIFKTFLEYDSEQKK